MNRGIYKGWNIGRGPAHPVTGEWRAWRYGVGMGNTTRDGLLRMIDLRNADEHADRAALEETT